MVADVGRMRFPTDVESLVNETWVGIFINSFMNNQIIALLRNVCLYFKSLLPYCHGQAVAHYAHLAGFPLHPCRYCALVFRECSADLGTGRETMSSSLCLSCKSARIPRLRTLGVPEFR